MTRTLVLLTCALLAACGSSAPPVADACHENSDCATGLVCALGACREPCTTSADCEPSSIAWSCENMVCVPPNSGSSTSDASTCCALSTTAALPSRCATMAGGPVATCTSPDTWACDPDDAGGAFTCRAATCQVLGAPCYVGGTFGDFACVGTIVVCP
jgi:hypothetical protein